MAHEVDDDRGIPESPVEQGSPTTAPAPAPAPGSSIGALGAQAAPAPVLRHRSSTMLDLLHDASDRSPVVRSNSGVAFHPQDDSVHASIGRSVELEAASDLNPLDSNVGKRDASHTAASQASSTIQAFDSDPAPPRDRVRAHGVTIALPCDLPVIMIKEEIRKRSGIPVGLQRLFYGDQELRDDLDVLDYDVVPGSRLILSTAVRVVVDAPTLGYPVAFDTVDAFDAVAHVKSLLEKFTEGALPAASTTLLFGGAEMEDSKLLLDYSQDGGMLVVAVPTSSPVEDEVEVGAAHQPTAAAEQPTMEVTPVPQPAAAAQKGVTTTERQATAAETNSEAAQWLRAARANLPRVTTVREASPAELKSEVAEALRAAAAAQGNWGMRVALVMPDALGGKSMVVEVSAHDKVDDLWRMAAPLDPPEPYYLMHRENIMNENKNMGWHGMRDGDAVYIFPGIVASGD